jgi:preprotein translocase subunit SecA
MSVMNTLNKLFSDPSEKELKRLQPSVKHIRTLVQSAELQNLTLATLPAQTQALQAKIANGATTDEILPVAFATVVRACELLQGATLTIANQTLTWNMIPYDVQLIGGMILHNGAVAEMKTGEGKTLVCTFPVYLNALTGKGVHVVTVNDYLAKRDATWMGLLYNALGLTVGTVVHDMTQQERKQAYQSDITYGTNNEFGFDYLRDNMTSSLDRQVQRGLAFAIVDEVDSILIDEARTPLIISQPSGESNQKYEQYSKLVTNLVENEHYNRDEKQKVATLTEDGIKKMEELLGVENIYTDRGFEEVHHIEQALRAQAMYNRDTDYVVRDGEVVIVDEFTGRLMPGRRYGHGLHQAIEAKEHVEVQRESKTLATITFQNYFRLYTKLAGMTGTAKTEEEEFESIYNLRTYVIPTNRPIARNDKPDAIYQTVHGKFMAVATLVKEKHALGQPVLVGTTSIEKSEALSALLKREGVPHAVLNAKHHQQEAEIVAGAGQKGSVTIATNMAGRGTDIKLGDGVSDLGGLCIVGTERHESRRIDNQLRGRAGRQGDPGETRFFVSMEDELMRLFGGDRLKSMMQRLKVPEDVALENSFVSRSIEGAQKRVEGRNFDIRKHVVQYDDVMNKHRTIIYKRRQTILERLTQAEQQTVEHPLHADVIEAIKQESANYITIYASDADSEHWNINELYETLNALHPQLVQTVTKEKIKSFTDQQAFSNFLTSFLVDFYEAKCSHFEPMVVAQAERVVTLRSIDTHWMNHIDDMAQLREQVAFAGFAQRDPLIEYKDQGFQRFRQLIATIDADIVRIVMQADLQQFVPQTILSQSDADLSNVTTNEQQIEGELRNTGVQQRSSVQSRQIRRNDAEIQQNIVVPTKPIPQDIAKFLPKKKK